MNPEKRNIEDDLSRLKQERDIFKKQFLKTQTNYENKIKELSIIKELGNTLRTTNFYDKTALFKEQLVIVKKYTGLERISLLLLNEELNILEDAADSDPGAAKKIEIKPGEGAPGRALLEKSPVVIDDTSASQGELYDGFHGNSLLCVPVMHNRKCIGVLCMGDRTAFGFDQNKVRFFSLVTDQIATAVILSRLYNQMLKEENRRFLLSRFFSKNVTETILGSGGNIRLGGERRKATIVFTDLHGFTAMSEGLDQEKVVEILNAYFSSMTPIIFQHDGTLDKLMGDGMMAIFGPPIAREDDTLRAVQSVIEMMTALKEFNEIHRHKGWPKLEVSIGVNTGEVVAGYIGSEDHFNYTVIGDAVSVAQRLRSIAGPGEIYISKSVRDEIWEDIRQTGGFKDLVSLPAQKVKGKEKAIEVFRVEIINTRRR